MDLPKIPPPLPSRARDLVEVTLPRRGLPARHVPGRFFWLKVFSFTSALLAVVCGSVSLLILVFGMIFGFLPFLMLSLPTHAWDMKAEAITHFSVLIFHASLGFSVIGMVLGNIVNRRGFGIVPVITNLCVAGLQLMVLFLLLLGRFGR